MLLFQLTTKTANIERALLTDPSNPFLLVAAQLGLFVRMYNCEHPEKLQESTLSFTLLVLQEKKFQIL